MANKTRNDPYKNFKFRVLFGAATVGLVGYLARRAMRRSTRPLPATHSKLFSVDHSRSSSSWENLQLPPGQIAELRDLAEGTRRGSRAAATALLAGASETDKSMAGQLIAARLGVDLYRVDMSRVVSKYIGETEKNLRRVFDAADGSGAVLLFDEADALFGKRSNVRDSHDRYANVEANYLLNRMEGHDGPVILATSRKQNIDAAFLRRLRYIVDFPPPDTVKSAPKPKRRGTASQRIKGKP